MKAKLILNQNDRTLIVMPGDLTIKSQNGDQFSVQEYLISEMDLCDLPSGIKIYPYDYFDDSGRTRSYHVPLILEKVSDTEAWVCFPELKSMDTWFPRLGGVLYPTLKRDLILKHTSFQPDIYSFEEQHYGIIDMEYSVIVSGTTVKEVITQAAGFDQMIETAICNVLSEVEQTCRAKLSLL